MALSSPDTVISVSDLNREVRKLLESSFPVMWIAGEISNLTVASSGHLYFSLKDAQAQARCVMFRNRAVLLPFRPQEGLRVEVRAQISLYEPRGDFQLAVDAMRPAGIGALYEAFERLKRSLAAEGMFDAARKKSLPGYPQRIGVITSPNAAALRDVLSALGRRAPHLGIVIYPVPVQGVDAGQKIARMIALASQRAEVDALLLVRGGGSIEDLWAFNEEVVARAIAHCAIPLICGVGHETDVTIADFVADQRAPTPTAAAELVAPERTILLGRIERQYARLSMAFMRMHRERVQRLDFLASRLISPRDRLTRQRERLAAISRRLSLIMQQKLQNVRWRWSSSSMRLPRCAPDLLSLSQYLDSLNDRRNRAFTHCQQQQQNQLKQMSSRLEALNPLAVLARGYSIVETLHGKVVSDAASTEKGDVLNIRFARGRTVVIVASLDGLGQESLF